jgi:YtkA-like
MRRLLLTTLVLAGLAYPEIAGAGCWATVELAPPPAATAPGDAWTAQVTVLQHGRNPLPDAAGARPTVTISNGATGETRTFTAHPTGKPGVYEAEVVFPSAGTWRYEVFDDFTSWNGEAAPCARTHELASVQIGAGPPTSAGASPGAPGGGIPLWPVVGAAMAALGGLGAGAGLIRRRRSERVAG